MRRSRVWAGFTGALLVGGGATTYVVIQNALTGGTVPPIAAAAGFGLLWTGGWALYAREKPDPPDKEPRPVLTVDWFLSDVHATVTCPCSPSDPFIVEGYQFGRYRCPHCKEPFQLPHRLEAHQRRADRRRKPRRTVRVT